MSEETLHAGDPQSCTETVIKEEDDSTDGVKSENNMCPNPQNKDSLNHSNGRAEKASSLHNSCGTRSNRKKMKVDWTPELHKKFVQAVEKLGVDQAIPSRILEAMKVEGLTRHNVASHLQKYRMHRRHILPKEDDRRWPQLRDQVQRSYYPHKPIMAYPPYHSNHALPPAPVYPVWGAAGSHAAGGHMWGPPGYSPWPQTESCHWRPYQGMHAEAWGCPVMPPHGPYSSISSSEYTSYASGFQSASMVNSSCGVPQKLLDLQPCSNVSKRLQLVVSDVLQPHWLGLQYDITRDEEVIDKVVKEAINKPWLPLPLGLKPPSADSVLAELSRQGVSSVPPCINGSDSF
ncbi:hypothetical protein OIU84_022595 [Salix udensis]|uniref:HTH myb-type domain-containing protein n=1 Tax=Salix udensis TaxID=889485 RepID=A0AAD6PEX7_9ROSI|nr:hypothetical protein OIU84_022595 [Salix udensis]